MSQFVISSELKFSKNVFAFTQEGVAMLSGVLRSDRAVHVNIAGHARVCATAGGYGQQQGIGS